MASLVILYICLPEDAGERQMIIIDKRRQTSKNILENLVRLINPLLEN